MREKEKVEDMPISEVRKCFMLITPVNSVIDQLHHCVMYMPMKHNCRHVVNNFHAARKIYFNHKIIKILFNHMKDHYNQLYT